MLSFIGFIVVWPIGCVILGMIINTVRARNGHMINDYFSFFMQGFALGPIAILGSFAPQAQQRGTAAALFWGGASGTVAASSVYLNSFA
jgi:hypothetical protein